MADPGADADVVVGVDGSQPSRRALGWAAREASRRGVTLRVAHAYPTEVALAAPGDSPRLHGAAERLLARDVDRARELAGGVTVVPALVDGPPAAVLVHESERASLLVVGGRGQGGFAGLLLGSTAVNVAARAACPVVVMPREGAAAPNGVADGPVVVGTDTSSTADRAMEFAFARARDRGARVVAVYAWQLPGSYSAYLARELLRTEDSRAERDARTLLADASAPWQRRYPALDVQRRAVLGHPVGALAEASSTAQIVVVGSRGSGPLTGMLLGSVSHGLLRHAQCPVVIAR